MLGLVLMSAGFALLSKPIVEKMEFNRRQKKKLKQFEEVPSSFLSSFSSL
jgi:hypothetical protein